MAITTARLPPPRFRKPEASARETKDETAGCDTPERSANSEMVRGRMPGPTQ